MASTHHKVIWLLAEKTWWRYRAPICTTDILINNIYILFPKCGLHLWMPKSMDQGYACRKTWNLEKKHKGFLIHPKVKQHFLCNCRERTYLQQWSWQPRFCAGPNRSRHGARKLCWAQWQRGRPQAMLDLAGVVLTGSPNGPSKKVGGIPPSIVGPHLCNTNSNTALESTWDAFRKTCLSKTQVF